MGALEDMEFQTSGLEFQTPDDIDAWLDNTTLPKAVQRRATAFADQWRTKLAHDLMDRLASDATTVGAQWEKTLAKLNDGIRRTLEIKKAMQSGRMSHAEGLREITKVAQQRSQILEVQKSLRSSVERWEALSDGTAEDYAASRGNRFSSSIKTSQVMTGAYLMGEVESPFQEVNR